MDKLKWSTHTDDVVKKTQQRLFNLRRLKKLGLSPKTLTNFYRCTIESILSGCITAWYGNCSAHIRKALLRVVRSAERIPFLSGMAATRSYGVYTSNQIKFICHIHMVSRTLSIVHP